VSEASHPPTPLSPPGRRALAAAVLGTATHLPPFAASLVVDVLDAACWAMLARAGATPQEAAAILADLWVPERRDLGPGPGADR
jgi:hypothetical protein